MPRLKKVTGNSLCSSGCVSYVFVASRHIDGCFKSSKPSQISYAEPYLRYLLETSSVKTDPTHSLEILALLHLAAALAAPVPLRPRAHSPSVLGQISTEDSPVTSFHSDNVVPTVGVVGVHYAPSALRSAEALSLFTRAFAFYDLLSRSRASTPSPSITPSTSNACQSVLGLDVPPQPQPASPIITSVSPTFAYCVPTATGSSSSPTITASRSLDSPRSSRLSGLCGRKGKLPPKTELWARASYFKLLQRLHTADASKGYADEAQKQLDIMR